MFGYWRAKYLKQCQINNDLRATVNRLEIERNDLFDKVKSAQELLGRAKQQNIELEIEIKDIDRVLLDTQKERDDLIGENGVLSDQVQDLENANQIIQTTIGEQQAQLGQQRKNIEKLGRKIQDIKAAFKVMQDIIEPPTLDEAFPLK